jgi:hypothetical protein
VKQKKRRETLTWPQPTRPSPSHQPPESSPGGMKRYVTDRWDPPVGRRPRLLLPPACSTERRRRGHLDTPYSVTTSSPLTSMTTPYPLGSTGKRTRHDSCPNHEPTPPQHLDRRRRGEDGNNPAALYIVDRSSTVN